MMILPVPAYDGCGRFVNSLPLVAAGPAPPVQIITPSLIMSMTLSPIRERERQVMSP
jgi:hypothetical protein